MVSNYQEFRNTYKLEISREQMKRIDKLVIDEFYLIKFSNDKPFNFVVSGSTKKLYNVRLLENNGIICDCMDMMSHCKRHKCVCKHICFLLLRVLKIFDSSYFFTLKLSSENIKNIEYKLKSFIPDEDIINNLLVENFNKMTIQFKLKKEIEQDDECSICYNGIKDIKDYKNNSVECPTCHNVFHNKCIEKWLQVSVNKNCVYCRSTEWKDYKLLKN